MNGHQGSTLWIHHLMLTRKGKGDLGFKSLEVENSTEIRTQEKQTLKSVKLYLNDIMKLSKYLRKRKPYTLEEERTILNYIIQKNGYHQLRGYKFWKQFAKDELTERTYHSLHERFRKHIINNLQHPAYCLSREEQSKIKVIYEETAQQKKKKKTNESQSDLLLLAELNSDDSDATHITHEEKKVFETDKDKKMAPDFFVMSDSESSEESIVYM